jgi:hypothetical protein
MRALVIILVLASASAHAGGPIVAGTDHTPPRFVDETRTVVRLCNMHKAKPNNGYGYYVKTWVTGYGSKADTVRLDWKSGGKVLASTKCESRFASNAPDRAEVECQYDGDKGLRVKGPLEAQLIMTDDQDSKDYLLRDFKVTVAQWTSFGDEVWQIVPDDLLAAGYAQHISSGDMRDHKIGLVFWTAAPDTGGDWELRCTVGDAKLDDVKASQSTNMGTIVAEQVKRGVSEHVVYTWTSVIIVPNLFWGSKSDDKHHASGEWLVDHPGDWTCGLRQDAKTVREFRFHVGDDGMIASDPMAAGAPPMWDRVALIDLRIPKDAKYDKRIRPDAMRKSHGFGLPWPSHPNVKTIQAAFPAASGLPDPS